MSFLKGFYQYIIHILYTQFMYFVLQICFHFYIIVDKNKIFEFEE